MNDRTGVRKNLVLFCLAWLLSAAAALGDEPKAPGTVRELFADFDPRKDPLDVKVVREWEKDGLRFRYVTFHIGSFKNRPARVAAFYGFPRGAKKAPGLRPRSWSSPPATASPS